MKSIYTTVDEYMEEKASPAVLDAYRRAKQEQYLSGQLTAIICKMGKGHLLEKVLTILDEDGECA